MCDRVDLRGATALALGGLRSRLAQFVRNLSMPQREFFRALAVEIDFIFAAIRLESRQVQNILILADFRVERVDALVQAVVIVFLLFYVGGVLSFGSGHLGELRGQAIRFLV